MSPAPRQTKIRKTRKTAWLAGLSESDRVLLVWVMASLALMAGLLGAAGASWLNVSDVTAIDRGAPNWVSLDSVRATSLDGDVIKAKVALDAPEASTRAWINGRPHQVALVLQISVSEYQNSGTGGAERVQRLGADMRTRLNTYLAENDVPPVQAVVIEDLVYSPR